MKSLLRDILAEACGALVATVFITAAGWLYSHTEIWLASGAVGIGAGLGCCIYVLLKRKPSPVIGGRFIWRYPRGRRWAAYIVAALVVMTSGATGYHVYEKHQSPDEMVVLVANFDGPSSQEYRVTDIVLHRLTTALESYDDVRIIPLDRTITEAGGSMAARAEGQKQNATIVIWGWYGLTEAKVPLSVHFEVLHPPPLMPPMGAEVSGELRMVPTADLQDVTLQLQLSDELAYLSLFTIGMTRFASGEWDEAIVSFDDALAQADEPVPALDKSFVHFYKGGAFIGQSDYDSAITEWSRAIQLQPDFALAYYNRSVAYHLIHRDGQALSDLDEVLRIEPEFAQAYVGRAVIFHQSDDNRAIADLGQAIRIDPDLADAYQGRAALYLLKGDHEHALPDLDRLLLLEPDNIEAYQFRTRIYCQNGEYDRAIADINQAIRLNDRNEVAYHLRGVAYEGKGDYSRAIADFSHAIRLNEDYALAYTDRATVYQKRNDYDRAIADYDQVIRLGTTSARTYYSRGTIWYLKKEYERALADLNQAIELYPDYLDAHLTRGAVYVALAACRRGNRDRLSIDQYES